MDIIGLDRLIERARDSVNGWLAQLFTEPPAKVEVLEDGRVDVHFADVNGLATAWVRIYTGDNDDFALMDVTLHVSDG